MFNLKIHKPIIYGEASLKILSPNLRHRFDIRPPIRRGDIERLLASSHSKRTVIIIDGLYGSHLAVTPTECRWLLEAGWILIGTASMGALRASDLWSVGMIGIGEVYTLFRLGYLRSDADVAVAYSETSYEEYTASIVHIRSIIAELEKNNHINSVTARKLLLKSRQIHWQERYWEILLDLWRDGGISDNIIAEAMNLIRNPKYHPKIRDAMTTVEFLLTKRWPLPIRS